MSSPPPIKNQSNKIEKFKKDAEADIAKHIKDTIQVGPSETPIAPPKDTDDKEVESWINNLLKAVEAIRVKTNTKPGRKNKPMKELIGKMECPICKKGTLHYGVSSYNNHVRAKCTTTDCVSFIE